LSDGTSLDPSYALTQDIRMEQLVKASRRLNELEEGKYPDALRVSLGMSPLLFLETARLLKGEKAIMSLRHSPEAGTGYRKARIKNR
jgi:hypothetical protein